MQHDAQPADERGAPGIPPPGVAATAYAIELLRSLGQPCPGADDLVTASPQALAQAVAKDWAASGLMPLCGEAAAPPQRARHAIPSCARGALLAFRTIAGCEVLPGVDGATLLSERAAFHGRLRAGRVSVNGQCHLLRTRDGWLAINLAREDDLALLPAWLAVVDAGPPPHEAERLAAGDITALQAVIRLRSSRALVARGALFGLPVAAPAEAAPPQGWFARATRAAVQAPARMPHVLDLSSLWAGPLAAHLLLAAGAVVTRVENEMRPDASRDALPAFHALLNAGKRACSLNFAHAAGLAALRAHIDAADIVLESARPRALQQLGIDAEEILARSPGKLWLRIAGHDQAAGNGPDSDPDPDAALPRVAFGDDAAIAGGAALEGVDGPRFCGDALADPLTGLHAATAALAHWRTGHGGLLTLSLAGVTRWCVERTRHIPLLQPDAATLRSPALRPTA